MKLTIFGASGRISKSLIEQALAEEHRVTAFARDPSKISVDHERLTVVEGDVKDYAAVGEAVAGADTVLSALGHTKTSTKDVQTVGTENIVAAMRKFGVKRLVSLTGAGVRDPKDEPKLFDKAITGLLKLLQRDVLEDGENHARTIENSGLDWIIVRGPMLTEGEKKVSIGLATSAGTVEPRSPGPTWRTSCSVRWRTIHTSARNQWLATRGGHKFDSYSPHRRTIRAGEFDGQKADKWVWEVHGVDSGKVLRNNAARAANKVMDRVSFRLRAFKYGLVHVQRVYGYCPDAAVQDESGRLMVEERMVVVSGRAVVLVPTGPYYGDHTLRELVFVGLQILNRDAFPRLFAAYVHYRSWPNEERRVYLVYAGSVLHEMVRGVDVGSGVRAEVQAQDVYAIVFYSGRRLEVWRGVSGEGLGVFVHLV